MNLYIYIYIVHQLNGHYKLKSTYSVHLFSLSTITSLTSVNHILTVKLIAIFYPTHFLLIKV